MFWPLERSFSGLCAGELEPHHARSGDSVLSRAIGDGKEVGMLLTYITIAVAMPKNLVLQAEHLVPQAANMSNEEPVLL